MKDNINILELLKDCPRGMKLDCSMFENTYFDKIDDDEDCLYRIICYVIDDGVKTTIRFTKFGGFNTMAGAKCVIFPKGKTTWKGFIPPCKFKDGDIIYVKDKYNQEWCSILSNCKDDKLYTYIDFYINYNILYYNKPNVLCECKYIIEYRLATEKEKAKLFKAIKDNGYKWDEETKTLEKLIEPKFKVGDKVTDKNKFIYRITEITDKGYKLHDLKTTFITFEEADLYFVKVVDIFDITTLKPFDKVLVRLTNDCVWMPKFFSHYDTSPKVKYYPFVTIDNIGYPQCIPYNGNEHLCRKTYNCDDFYKNWK